MKLKKYVGFLIGAAVMLTGCMSTSTDDELTPQEKELKAVRSWFENDMTDEDEFSDLTDYQYYSRTIGLEMNDLLSPDMWEVYYSDIINLNK